VTANRPPRSRKGRRSRKSYRDEGSSRGESRLILSYSAFSKKRPIKSLHNRCVLSIDLSAIMASSGIRGQFGEKFKALLRDIEDDHSDSSFLPSPHSFHGADTSSTKLVSVLRSIIMAELLWLRIRTLRHPFEPRKIGKKLEGCSWLGLLHVSHVFSSLQPRLLVSLSTSISPVHFLAHYISLLRFLPSLPPSPF